MMIVLVTVLIALLVSGLTVQAQNNCVVSVSHVGSKSVVTIQGCDEVSINGTPVYPNAPMPTPTQLFTATSVPNVVFPDGGSTTAPSQVASAFILAGELNVRPLASLDSPAPVGKAQKGRYYEIICQGDDNWYQIKFTPSAKENWIHAIGQKGIYATILVPKEVTIPDCSAEG